MTAKAQLINAFVRVTLRPLFRTLKKYPAGILKFGKMSRIRL